ncbi:unnamed protein product [[Candida] boidinii]|nr:unnamed protein product [[Candida] boidinii]
MNSIGGSSSDCLFSNGQNGIQEQNQQQPLAPGQIQNQLSHDAILNLDGGDIDIDAIFSSPSEIGDIQIKEESLDGDLDDDDLIDDIINSGSHRPSLPTPTDSASLTSPLSDSSPAGSTQKKRLDKSKFSTNSKNVATSNTKVTKVKRERTTHNVIEKKYRTNINSKIIALRDSVPSLRAATTDSTTTLEELEGLTPAVKLNKAIILSKATEYIKFLETKNTALINELMILRSSLNSHGPPPIGHAGPGMQHSGEPVAPNVVPQVVSHPHMAQHNMGPVPPQMVYMGGPAPPQIITNDSTVSTNDSMMNNNSNYNSTLMNNGGNNSSLNSSQAYDIPNNRDMSLGNKLLVGGMTALVGSQMFGGMTAGGSFDNGNYQYRDLSFIPIFKLLPILENENFVKFFDIIRILLFVCETSSTS